MSSNLVIVESPAKGKTIEKYLGPDYTVLASYGHVRDLVPKEGAVDPANDFAMRYELIDRNKKHVDAIRKALKKADHLLLATDPDREGEAISWHLMEHLRDKGDLKGKTVKRVVFHEITKGAVRDAVANPRDVSVDLVNAQQARRALDYLVGFNLSPLLWRKIKAGLSAGRVQSPALRLIVDREKEIEAFIAQEYWTIDAKNRHHDTEFTAKISLIAGEKAKQFSVTNEADATALKARLLAAASGTLIAQEPKRRERKRNPSPPFTTSTLQQEAVRKLGFSSQRTMRVAQGLYEGVSLGSEGQVGLITYMRTDSLALSQDSLNEIRTMIPEHYGPEFLPESAVVYKNKSKNAQEAHEAIRPTSAYRTPKSLAPYLDKDQAKLYELIYKRTIASQMTPAVYDQMSVELDCGSSNDQFRATGSVLKFSGFLSVYREGLDDNESEDKENSRLPEIEAGDRITLLDIVADQHFTEPPPRFTEATLVKALEEFGIGRPSTYASIISTLQSRDYVEIEARRFFPTDVGKVVANFLSNHFERYVDYDFTAQLEDKLDAISRGESEWVPVLGDFWGDFKSTVDEKFETVSRDEAIQSRELGTDPVSGKPVSARLGRFGPIVQIGHRDDDEKPRFAPLLPGQRMDSISLEEALELFKLPRELGETESGQKITTNIGRFGPYVKYGSNFVSLKEHDPYTITHEQALEVIAAKIKADAEKLIKTFDGTDIQILMGRWGPYVTDGNKNGKIPKELKETPKAVTLEQAQQWLAEAPEKKGRRKAVAKKAPAKKATAKKTTTKKTTTKKAT
ncbi:MAG: DNA topoisomerase I [Gammaproteobacteria bacterium]|nr:DNA topoisomerase I [Gammaproteobacteria bacterium]